MRMFAIPNQSSVPMAYTQFTDAQDPADHDAFVQAEGGSRLKPSGNRDRVVDVMEELFKYTLVMRQHFDLFGDRHDAAVRAIEVIDSHSHRTVRDNREIGRLLSLVALAGLRD